MSEIALTVSVLALVAVVGLWIGNVKIRGVGFGIGGVLFGGIIVGHFVDQAGVALSSPMLHFIQEFGLILFVYTIGIQVGPGFFASLRVSGLRLNLFAILIVILGGLVTAVLHKLFNIPSPGGARYLLRCGDQHASAGGRAANSPRSRRTVRGGRSDGDELRDGVSVRHLRHSADHVAGAPVLPNQCGERGPAV